MRAAVVFLISVTRRHIVNTVLPARRKDLEELKKPGSGMVPAAEASGAYAT